MNLLKESFRKNGFNYKQIVRNNKAAIYSQDDRWYEVIKIRVRGEMVLDGNVVEAGESYPPSERWGTLGWTYGSLEDAMKKYDEISTTVQVSDTTAAEQSSEPTLTKS